MSSTQDNHTIHRQKAKDRVFLLMGILLYGLIIGNADDKPFPLMPIWSFWPAAAYGTASFVLLLLFGFTESSKDTKSDD